MNADAEGIVHLRERMKEKGFSKKDQQAIREMTRLYRHSKSKNQNRGNGNRAAILNGA